MGGVRQPSLYRRYVVPHDPLLALRTLRLLFEGCLFAFGTAVTTRFVLPVVFGESILFEETTRIAFAIGAVVGVAFATLLAVTVLRVLWRR